MELYGNRCGKSSLFGNVRNCMEIGEKLCMEMCGYQIWLRSGLNWFLNLILNAVKIKKTIVKSC